ncbi:MAG: 4-alpha-glucanotransferase [Muribaculaceae bacterium]|nr:4-alpha-glucanotransferase [Muribaculaceae bacterium]
MKIGLHIEYHTRWGETLRVCGSSAGLGGDNPDNSPVMQSADGINWTLYTDAEPGEVISYNYIMTDSSGNSRREWGAPRRLKAAGRCSSIEVIDRWHDRPADSPFYSTAFSECIFARPNRGEALEPEAGTLALLVAAPMIDPRQRVLICGNTEALGNWNPALAKPLTPLRFPLWAVTVEAPQSPLEFKFLVADSNDNRTWENRDNRTFNPTGFDSSAAVLNYCGTLANPMPLWRGAGVAIPVFSLRSDEDMGIGDFEDIIQIADWAADTGQRIVQLLPVNDTTTDGGWGDSYPYNSISSFALNPIYLRPQEIGQLKSRERMAYYAEEAAKLNTLPEVDYPAAFRLKSAYLREFFAEQGNATTGSDDFKQFVAKNAHWLEPYIAFCLLRDRFSTTDTNAWGEYSVYSADKAASILGGNPGEADYYRFLQYHADRQLRKVRSHCHSIGVALKGDIPIGISRTSVDAWLHPELFNLDASAGAPPDAFAINGQNWGFPTYNWEKMSEDGFTWWKDRFRKMADYFDAYRIDHLLGFFRIWQIPLDAIHGLLGIFNSALPFTPEELKYNYDFNFDRSAHTRPYITDAVLDELFGGDADTVRSTYLTADYGNRYRLRPEYDTQCKIADSFPRHQAESSANRIYNGLLRLVEEVLFIEDPWRPNTWHPRISASSTYAFKALSPYEQQRFAMLYQDFFFSRNDDYWREKALWKLPPLIDSTGMLCCGEDLGMIPACVPSVMEQLEILSLKVQRMPDDPSREFADTRRYPYYCVCTTSTHDMGGLRQWWEEDPRRTSRFYNNALSLKGDAPYYAEPWICDRVITDHLTSPAMLCILPLQDWLSIDGEIRRQDPRQEQINDPANPANRWCYRMHITLRTLAEQHDLNSYLRKKIKASGR